MASFNFFFFTNKYIVRQVDSKSKLIIQNIFTLFERENDLLYSLCQIRTTVEPLKTATLWGMENWPSYGGGRLIEVNSESE